MTMRGIILCCVIFWVALIATAMTLVHGHA